MLGKKEENYQVPKIESLIKVVDENLPATATEWDAMAECHFTFFSEFNRKQNRQVTENQLQKGLVHWEI